MNDRERELVLRYVDGDLDDAERAELEALVSAAPELVDEIHRASEDRVTLVDFLRSEADGDARGRRRRPRAPARRRSRAAVTWALRITAVAAALLVTTYLVRPDGAPRRQAHSAVATDVTGAVVRTDARGRAADVEVGDGFGTGDLLVVGPASTAALRFADGTVVACREDTSLSMPVGEKGKTFDMAYGTLEATVTPQPAGTPLTVRTDQAVAVVRGTAFTLAAGDGATRLEVSTGRVLLSRRWDGASLEVAAGQYAVAGADARFVVMRAGEPLPLEGIVVAPDGRADGEGSHASPLSLAAACERDIEPGTTVWLSGGRYTIASDAVPVIRWKGTRHAPITVRSAPGAWAVIDGRLEIDGAAHVALREFEMLRPHDSHKTVKNWMTRRPKERPADQGAGFAMGGYLVEVVTGDGIELARLYLHDNVSGGGIGIQHGSRDVEARGCVVVRCGWDDKDRGHGFGIDVRNRTIADDQPVKTVHHNIVAGGRSTGIRAEGVSPDIVALRIRHNIAYASGMTSWTRGASNLSVGSDNGRVDDVVITDNHLWHPDGLQGFQGGRVDLGFGRQKKRGRLEFVRNRVFGGGSAPLRLRNWERVVFTDNIVCYESGLLSVTLPADAPGRWTVDRNTYAAADPAGPFVVEDEKLTWDDWRARSGFDRDSTFTQDRPADAEAFVVPVDGERGVAHVAAYNPRRAPTVAVDPSGFLSRGDRYVILNALDFRGPPAVQGRYAGGTVSVPVAADPLTGRAFAAFVLERHR